ncbi:SCP2 sterol-binding domain-containing protein [Nitrospira sp. M1]|nr:MAG: hypothetical protein NPIRA02_41760 [Nitrospirales bacterium]
MASYQQQGQSGMIRQADVGGVVDEFMQTFPNLFGRKRKTLQECFKRMARSLSNARRSGAIQFGIRDGKKMSDWCLTMTPEGCQVAEAKIEHPTLEILTDKVTWMEVANGKMAPMEAFGQGKMRVRGDLQLARVLVRRLHR